jgi:hypothetical protein
MPSKVRSRVSDRMSATIQVSLGNLCLQRPIIAGAESTPVTLHFALIK